MTAVLLLKADPDKRRPPVTIEERGTRPGRPRIRCPRCDWEPGRDHVWMCTCLHVWNTFETGGICPECGRQWQETQCARCKAWSPHADWYADDAERGR